MYHLLVDTLTGNGTVFYDTPCGARVTVATVNHSGTKDEKINFDPMFLTSGIPTNTILRIGELLKNNQK